MSESSAPESSRPALPVEPVQRVVAPITRFLHVEAASGVVLLICTAIALILANSAMGPGFLSFWKTPIGIEIGSFQMRHSLQHWINDGLMVIFFFVIGLEVKRELVLGELRDFRQAVLPIAAAIGGMVVPAGLYLALQWNQPGQSGWGIPMATDIAFVVGCMAILGPRIPHKLRIMLLSLAIADDIGAILVIAIGYTETIHFAALLWGIAGIGVIAILNRIGVRAFPVYTALGVLVWLAFHESGVHATIAGVILGLMTPAKNYIPEGIFGDILDYASRIFRGGSWPGMKDRAEKLRQLRHLARETVSPLEYLESTLHPWVSFVIMPLFALANAGVVIHLSSISAPVAVAVMLALFFGKSVGIVGMTWLATRFKMARLPEGVGWGAIAGGGFLAGIGFTMALFISGLAIKGPLLDIAKIGVLIGSVLSAIAGMTLLLVFLKPPEPETETRSDEAETN